MDDDTRDAIAFVQYVSEHYGDDDQARRVERFVADNAEAIEVGLRLWAMNDAPKRVTLRCMQMNRPPYWFASGVGKNGVIDGEYATPLEALRGLDTQRERRRSVPWPPRRLAGCATVEMLSLGTAVAVGRLPIRKMAPRWPETQEVLR